MKINTNGLSMNEWKRAYNSYLWISNVMRWIVAVFLLTAVVKFGVTWKWLCSLVLTDRIHHWKLTGNIPAGQLSCPVRKVTFFKPPPCSSTLPLPSAPFRSLPPVSRCFSCTSRLFFSLCSSLSLFLRVRPDYPDAEKNSNSSSYPLSSPGPSLFLPLSLSLSLSVSLSPTESLSCVFTLEGWNTTALSET